VAEAQRPLSKSRRMPPAPDPRALAVIGGANVFIGILLVVQMWLLSASLETFLAGHDDGAIPGAIVSGLLFLGCLLLARFMDRADRTAAK
jgi:hypothetical protein